MTGMPSCRAEDLLEDTAERNGAQWVFALARMAENQSAQRNAGCAHARLSARGVLVSGPGKFGVRRRAQEHRCVKLDKVLQIRLRVHARVFQFRVSRRRTDT